MKKEEDIKQFNKHYQGKNKENYQDTSSALVDFARGMKNAMSAGWEGGVASWYYYQKKLAETQGQAPKVTIPSMGYNTGVTNPNPYLINYERDKANKEHLEKVQTTMDAIREGVELEAQTEKDKEYIQQAKQSIDAENKLKESLEDKAEFEKMINDYVNGLPNSVARFGAGISLGFAEYVSNPVRLGADVIAGTALSTIGTVAGVGTVGMVALDYGADIFTDVAFDSFERTLKGEEDSTWSEKADVAKDTIINKTILKLGGKVVKKLMHKSIDGFKVDNPTPEIVTSKKEVAKAVADTVINNPQNKADTISFQKKMQDPDTKYHFAKDNRNRQPIPDTEMDRVIYQPQKNEYVQGKRYFTNTDLNGDDVKIINDNQKIGTIDTETATETKMNLENEYRQKAGDKVFESTVEYETNTKGINEVQNNYTIDPNSRTIIKNNNQTILSNKEEALTALFETPDAMRAVYVDAEDNMKTEIIKWNDDEIYMIKSPQETKKNKEILARHNQAENQVIRNNALSSVFLIDKNGNIVKSLTKGSIQKIKNQKIADEVERLLSKNIHDLSKEIEINTADSAVQGKYVTNTANTSADDITEAIVSKIRALRNDLQNTDLAFLQTLEFTDKDGKIIRLDKLENIIDGTLDSEQVLKGLLNMPVEQESYAKLGAFFREKASVERALNKGTSVNENYLELFNDKSIKTEILDKIFIEDADGNVRLNTTESGFFKNGIEETVLYYSINPNAIDSGEGLFAGIGDRETLKQLLSYIKDEFDIDDINTYALHKFLNNDEMNLALDLGIVQQDSLMGGNILTPATFIEGFSRLLRELSNPNSKYDKNVLLKIANNLTAMDKLPAKHIINDDGTTGKLSMNFLDYILNNKETGTVNIKDLNEAIKDIPKDMRTSIDNLTKSIGSFIKSQKDNTDVSKLTMQTTTSTIKTLENLKKVLLNDKISQEYISSSKFEKDITNLNQAYSILSFDNENVFDVKTISNLKNLTPEELQKAMPEILNNIDNYLNNVNNIKQGINIPEMDRVEIDTKIDELKTSAMDFATKTKQATDNISSVHEIIDVINNKLNINKDVKKFVSSKKFAQNQTKLAQLLETLNAPKTLINRVLNFDGTKYGAKTDKPKLIKMMSDIQNVIDKHNINIGKADATIKEIINMIDSGNATDLIGQKKFQLLLDKYVKQLKSLHVEGVLDSTEISEIASKISADYNSKVVAEKFLKNAQGLQEAVGILKQLDNIFSTKESSPSYRYIKDKDAMVLFDRLNNLINKYPEIKKELKELSIYSDMTNKLNQVFKSLGESKANSPAKRMKDVGKEINLAPLSKEEHLDNALLEKTINKKITLQDKGLFKKIDGSAENIIEAELIAGKEIEVDGAFDKYVSDKHKDLFIEIYNDSIQYLKNDVNDIPMSLDEFTVWYAQYLRAVDTSRTPFTITGGYSPLIRVAELFPSREQFISFLTNRKVKGHLPYQQTSAQLIESLSSKTNLRIAEYSQLGQTTYALSKRLTKGTFNKGTINAKNTGYLSRTNTQRHVLARVKELNPEGHSVTTLQEEIANRIGKNFENFGNKAMEDIQITTKDITPRKVSSTFFRYLATQILKWTGINEASNKGNFVLSLIINPDKHGRSVVGSIDKSGKYKVTYANIKRTKRILSGIENTGYAVKDGWVNRAKMVRNVVNSFLHFKNIEKASISPMDFTAKARTYGVDPELIDATKAEDLFRRLAQDAKGNISKHNIVNKLGAIYNHWETGVFSTQLAQDMAQSIWAWRNVIEFIKNIKDMPFENIDDQSAFILKSHGINQENYGIFQEVLKACNIENGESLVLNILKGNFDDSLFKNIDALDINKVQNLIRALHVKYGSLNPKDVFTTHKSNFTEALSMFLKRTTSNLGVSDLRRAFYYQTPNGSYRLKLSTQLEDKDWLEILKWGGAGLTDNYLKFIQLAVAGGVGLMAKNMVSDITKINKNASQLIGEIQDIQDNFVENEGQADRYATAFMDLNKMLLNASKDNINAFTLATSGGDLKSLIFDVIEPTVRTWINIEKGKGYSDAELKEKFGMFYLSDTEPQTKMSAYLALAITFLSNAIFGDSGNFVKGLVYPQSFGNTAREEKDLKSLAKNDPYGNRQLFYSSMINKKNDTINYLVNKAKLFKQTLDEDIVNTIEKAKGYMMLDDFYENTKASLEDIKVTNVAINQNIANALLDEQDIDKNEYDQIIIDSLESIGVSKNFNNLDEVAKDVINNMIAIKLGNASKVDNLKFKAEVMMYMGQNPSYSLRQIERDFIPNIEEIKNKNVTIYKSFNDMPEDVQDYYKKNLKQYCTKNEFLVYANNGKTPKDIIDDSINNKKFYIDKNPEEETIEEKPNWDNYMSNNIPIKDIDDNIFSNNNTLISKEQQEISEDKSPDNIVNDAINQFVNSSPDILNNGEEVIETIASDMVNNMNSATNKIKSNNIMDNNTTEHDMSENAIENKSTKNKEIPITEKITDNKEQNKNPDIANDNIVSELIDKSIGFIKNSDIKNKVKGFIDSIMDYNTIHNTTNEKTIIPEKIKEEIKKEVPDMQIKDLSDITDMIDIINQLPINKEPEIEDGITLDYVDNSYKVRTDTIKNIMENEMKKENIYIDKTVDIQYNKIADTIINTVPSEIVDALMQDKSNEDFKELLQEVMKDIVTEQPIKQSTKNNIDKQNINKDKETQTNKNKKLNKQEEQSFMSSVIKALKTTYDVITDTSELENFDKMKKDKTQNIKQSQTKAETQVKDTNKIDVNKPITGTKINTISDKTTKEKETIKPNVVTQVKDTTTNTKTALDEVAKAKYVTKKGQGVVKNDVVKQLIDLENAPEEIKWLWKEMETVKPKTGDKRIKEYFKSIGWGQLSAKDNWCAGILSACYTANGYKLKTKTVNAQQFAQNGKEVEIPDAQVGDVLVFRNRNKKGHPIKTGHVNMVIYKDDKYIVAIGGNQSTTNSNERDGLNGINCKLYSLQELKKKQKRPDRRDLSVIRVNKVKDTKTSTTKNKKSK